MSVGLQVNFLISGLLDADGDPLSGGKVYTYAAGTTTDQATYQDAAKTIAHTNPVVLNSLGQAVVYADGNYKFRITDADDVAVATIDNLWFGVPSTSLGVVAEVSSDYTVQGTDDFVFANAATGDIILSLPSASTVTGKRLMIKKTDSSANTVTVDPYGAELVEGESSVVLAAQYAGACFVSDGSGWVKSDIAIDEDDMASDSAAHPPSQQAVKAFVTSGTITMTNKTLTDPSLNAAFFPEGSNPTTGTSVGVVFVKDSGTQPELYFRSESDGTVVPITANGTLANSKSGFAVAILPGL